MPEPGYDDEALAEIDLTSELMIAANWAPERLRPEEIDRVLLGCRSRR